MNLGWIIFKLRDFEEYFTFESLYDIVEGQEDMGYSIVKFREILRNFSSFNK